MTRTLLRLAKALIVNRFGAAGWPLQKVIGDQRGLSIRHPGSGIIMMCHQVEVSGSEPEPASASEIKSAT